MTTAREPIRRPAISLLRAALAATLGVGLTAVLVALVTSGTPAAAGAGIAVAMVCLFFGSGVAVLGVVARLAPAISLLVALLTYALKVVLVGLVFLALTRSGTLDGAVDARWLAGTVIVCTLTWLTTQILFSVRARQPLYDLPPYGQEADAR